MVAIYRVQEGTLIVHAGGGSIIKPYSTRGYTIIKSYSTGGDTIIKPYSTGGYTIITYRRGHHYEVL